MSLESSRNRTLHNFLQSQKQNSPIDSTDDVEQRSSVLRDNAIIRDKKIAILGRNSALDAKKNTVTYWYCFLTCTLLLRWNMKATRQEQFGNIATTKRKTADPLELRTFADENSAKSAAPVKALLADNDAAVGQDKLAQTTPLEAGRNERTLRTFLNLPEH